MKKLLFSFVAAFIAAVMAFRCAELGEPMPVVLVAAALIGALAEYVLWSFFPDKRRVSRYKMPIKTQSHLKKIEKCKNAEPVRRQNIILKGAILERSTEDEIRAFYEGVGKNGYIGKEYNCGGGRILSQKSRV